MNALVSWLVARNGGHMPMTKLLKLVYYADFYAAARLGRPITGCIYRAWEGGPVSLEVYHAQEERQLTSVRVEELEDRWDFTNSGEAEDGSSFSPAERDLIDYVWRKYGAKSGRELSALAHGELPWMVAWEHRKQGDPASDRIDYDLAAAEYGEDADDSVRENESSRAALARLNETLARLGVKAV